MSPLRAWSDPLAEHIVGTYFALRAAMAIMAVGLPLLLVGWSLLDPDLPVLGSMSEYYYSPARDVFVGVLVGTGIALICYRGYGRRENRLLNAAGALLVVVALVPTDPPGQNDFGLRMSVHAVAAVAFFVSFAVSVWWCADDTLDATRDSSRRIGSVRLTVDPTSASVSYRSG